MLDLRRLCQALHVPTLDGGGSEHATQGWIQLNCPFCDKTDEGFHLGFNPSSGAFHCWRCGTLRTWSVVGGLLRTTSSEAIHQTIQKYQAVGDRPVRRERREEKGECPPPPHTEPLSEAHRIYLQKRGFDPDYLVDEWGLRGTRHLSGAWNWRVVYPIRDKGGRIVAWQGRAISDGTTPKYKMTNRTDVAGEPRRLLYGIERAVGDTVIIVEGATGVWRIGPGAVATLGIGWKPEQAGILRQYTRRIILFDPEPVAQRQARGLAGWLAAFPGETEIVDGFKVDPGELTKEQVRQIRRLLR